MFSYLIAAGDKALFSSQESCEDDPALGVSDLIQVIDCGFSRLTTAVTQPNYNGYSTIYLQ